MQRTFVIAQSNFTAGHIDGNLARMKAVYDIAVTLNADMVIFPEMAITGYPTEDLTLSRSFQNAAMQAVESLAAGTGKTTLLTGGLWREGDALYNTAFLMEDGRIMHRQYKYCLPNYGVFDEKRLFSAGLLPAPVHWRGMNLGIMICEDMWIPAIAAKLKQEKADMLVTINASPYEAGKALVRKKIAAARVAETGLPLVYVNPVCGQDELVFDGGSFVMAQGGKITMRLQYFQEDIAQLYMTQHGSGWQPEQGVMQPEPQGEESIYHAMVMGLYDFTGKNGFAGIVLGLSGGIDSALSAAVAVDAVGKDRVRAVLLPSPVTSAQSRKDALECAARLGIKTEEIPITSGMDAFRAVMKGWRAHPLFDIAEGNNQTRLRCGMLTAISTLENLLLLNTSNKSEAAVGYTNLYGDLTGHYSVLKDLYKTKVYDIARWRNSMGEVIPESILTKPPSAELRESQKDEDVLPPYATLDAILECFIEEQLSTEEIIALGFERAVVEKVAHMVHIAEHKRRQAPPGVKITSMSLGRDRRYPLTSGWRG